MTIHGSLYVGISGFIIIVANAAMAQAGLRMPPPLVIELTTPTASVAPLPPPAPRPTPDSQKTYNPNEIAALLDKRPNNSNPILDKGANQGNQELTSGELKGFKDKLMACWDLPASAISNLSSYYLELHILLKPDGTAEKPPVVAALKAPNSTDGATFEQMALKAFSDCAPYSLPKDKFGLWQRVIIRFDASGRNLGQPVQDFKGGAPATPAPMNDKIFTDLRKRIVGNWQAPEKKDDIVTLRLLLDRDGMLTAVPSLINEAGKAAPSAKAVQSAIQAVYKSLPLDMLPAANYDSWKMIEMTFDPSYFPN